MTSTRRALIVAVLLLAGRSVFAQGGTTSADRFKLNTGPCVESSGSGSPEGAIVGVVCDTWHQTNSPYDIWRKTSGTGNTGWVKITTGGTVTSVAITGPSLVSWANSPVTTSGTLTATWTSGSAGQLVRNSGGTGAAWSTTTWPNSATLGDLLAATGANGYGNVAAVAVGQVLASAGTGTLPAYTASPSLTSIGGAATLTLNPTGDLILNPAGFDVLPANSYETNVGHITKKYKTLYAAELLVETLVAQNTIATIGGRVLVIPTTVLVTDLVPLATTIHVKHNQIAEDDIVYMEADGKFEAIGITSGAGGGVGEYTYTVTRDLDGSGPAGGNQWYAGDAMVNTGAAASPVKGFIDLYALSGILLGAGPAIVGNVRVGTGWSAIEPRWAIGNLNATGYDYATDIYGAAFGVPTATNVTVDATNGFRIRHGTTNKFLADTSGNLSLVGNLSISTAGTLSSGATAFGTGTGYWLAYNAGTPQFRIGTAAGDRFAWDGSAFTLASAAVSINASGIQVTTDAGGGISAGNAYKFTPSIYSGSTFGMYGSEDTGSTTRYLFLRNVSTNATAGSEVSLWAQNSSGTPKIARIAATVAPAGVNTSEIVLFADLVGVSGNVLLADGLLTVAGFGVHAFTGGAGSNSNNTINLSNLSNGNAASASILMDNDARTSNLTLRSTGSGYNDGYTADGVTFRSNGAGGMAIIAQHASAGITFWTGGATIRTSIDLNGLFTHAYDFLVNGTSTFGAVELPGAAGGGLRKLCVDNAGTLTVGASCDAL